MPLGNVRLQPSSSARSHSHCRPTAPFTYLIKRSLEALPVQQIPNILAEPGQPAPSTTQRRPHLWPLALGVPPKVIDQRNARPGKERRDRDIRNRILAHRKAAAVGEQGLEVLGRLVQILGGTLALDERLPGGGQLGGDAVDEEAGAGALDGVRGEDVGLREEVGDELDEDERLGELGRRGRGLLGRDGRSAVGDRGDLQS